MFNFASVRLISLTKELRILIYSYLTSTPWLQYSIPTHTLFHASSPSPATLSLYKYLIPPFLLPPSLLLIIFFISLTFSISNRTFSFLQLFLSISSFLLVSSAPSFYHTIPPFHSFTLPFIFLFPFYLIFILHCLSFSILQLCHSILQSFSSMF